MSGVMISGGLRGLLRTLHCTRCVSRWDAAQEGSLGQTDGGGAPSEPPAVPYWEDESPPPVTDRYPETAGDAMKPSRRESTRANFIKPEVSLQRLRATGSIISIVFGLKRLAWAHVDRTRTVRAWQQHEWSQLTRGKQHPDLYLADVSSAVSRLPAADIYILEKSSVSAQNAAMFPVTLHLRIVEAMLYALLNPGYAAEQEHRVFSVARTTVGKHFDIMVGGTKTSGVDLVQRLVEEAASTQEQPRVRFTPELICQYKHRLHPCGQYRHEEMCDALLQAIAVLELAGQR
ncbi:transcription elongation factor, mitochondrial [Phyllobates terribilis]|uniref:transcription elongation factor, mitochondrial n=1 Tax=Phyllobates terribilis TaxID=111132 RepID=UPI003CCADF5C